MGHTVDGLPSMASGAWSGASASPSGENTVARTGFTILPVDTSPPPRLRRRRRRVQAQLVAAEAAADVAEDPAQHGRQHDQRDDDDRAADAKPDHQPLAAARRGLGIVGRRAAEPRRRRRPRFVDGRDSLGAVGDRGGLLQQVQQGGGAADAAALLHRPRRCRRDLERDVAVDGPRFDGLACRVELGGRQPAADSGLGQRPAVDQQRVERGADAADVVLRRGVRQRRRERQRHVALDADPHAAGMVDRQCDARPVGGLGGRGQRLDGAGPADRRRRRLGHFGQRPAADPLATPPGRRSRCSPRRAPARRRACRGG